jgi:hypothetical protein
MTNRPRTISPTLPLALAQSTRPRRPCAAPARRLGIRRIRRRWFSPPPLPSIEEAEARMRSHRGFFASLTREQIAFIKAWDGPEICGDPNGPKRTF